MPIADPDWHGKRVSESLRDSRMSHGKQLMAAIHLTHLLPETYSVSLVKCLAADKLFLSQCLNFMLQVFSVYVFCLFLTSGQLCLRF